MHRLQGKPEVPAQPLTSPINHGLASGYDWVRGYPDGRYTRFSTAVGAPRVASRPLTELIDTPAPTVITRQVRAGRQVLFGYHDFSEVMVDYGIPEVSI